MCIVTFQVVSGLLRQPRTQIRRSYVSSDYPLSNYWSAATKEQSSTATVSCGQRPKHLRGHREDIAVVNPHSSLWPKATTFERSQRGVFLVASPTVHCGQRPQQLGDQRVYYNSGILDHSGHLFSTGPGDIGIMKR